MLPSRMVLGYIAPNSYSILPSRIVLGFIAPIPETLTSCSIPFLTVSAMVTSTNAFTFRWSTSPNQSGYSYKKINYNKQIVGPAKDISQHYC